MRISRLKTIGISALQGAILPFSNLILASLGIYLFGTENWGSFVFTQLLIFPIILISNWGSRNFLIRQFSREPAGMSEAFLTNIKNRALLLPLSLILFVILPVSTALLSIFIVVLSFFFMSYDGPTVFKERFEKRIIAEILGLICFVIGLFFLNEFDLNSILCIQASVIIIKSIYMSFALKDLKLFHAKSGFKFIYTIKAGFPFFAIGLSGWLQSKTDLYMLTIMRGSDEIAAYQLFVGGLLVVQAIIGFLIEPLIKFIYRSKEAVFKRLGILIFKVGLPIIIIGLFMLFLILEELVPHHFDNKTYLFAFLYLIPFLLFMPSIFKLYKANKGHKVVYISFIASGVNLVLTWFLIPPMGLNGALLGSACSQVFLLILYKGAVYFLKAENNS